MAPIDLTAELPPDILDQPPTTELSELAYDPTLIQHGTCRRVGPRTIESPAFTANASPQPYADISPETQPIEEYDNPLSLEEIMGTYAPFVTLQTGLAFYDDTQPLEPAAFEQLRRQAKKEITIKMIHKLGVPTDYTRFLDIDTQETRELLLELNSSIPEAVDRENSLNGFSTRTAQLKAHIIEQHEENDPNIRQRIKQIDEHWIADLKEREKILASTNKQPTRDDIIARQRKTFIERLIDGAGSAPDLIAKVGNCLLHLTQEEVREAIDHEIGSASPQDDAAKERLARLRATIEELHLTSQPT